MGSNKSLHFSGFFVSKAYYRGDYNVAREPHAARPRHWCGSRRILLIMFGRKCKEQNILFYLYNSE
jgi:hypothetical protein